MKKLFTLFVAFIATLSVFAGEIVLTPAGLTAQTQTDINVTVQGVTLKYFGSLTASDFRLFAKQGDAATNDLTISYAKNITKVEIIGTTKGATDGSDITATPGVISAAAGASTQTGQTVEITINNINATSLTLSVVKQLRMQQITLTVDGEGEGGDQGGNEDGDQGGNEDGDQGGNEGGDQGGNDPVNPSDTLSVAQAIAVAKGAPGNTQYIVKGYVTYSYGYKEQYGNIDLFISDTPDGGQDFEIFRATLVNGEPQVGDLVVGTGTITTFVKGDGTTIYEITNGTVKILEEGEGGGNEGGEGEGGEEGDTDYSWEPTEITTINKTFTQGGSYENYEGIVDFYVEDDTDALELYFISNSTTGVPAGTYPINDSGEEGTVYASPGGDDYYDYPSFYLANFEYIVNEYGEGYLWDAYYIVSGTVTVTGDNSNQTIVVAAKSYNGSTLNITYTGLVEEWVDEETGVENVTTTTSNTRKVFQNGQIYIIRDNVQYNLLGIQVK